MGLLDIFGINATVFVTRNTDMRSKFDKDRIELGIRPNYIKLLSGDGEVILEDIKAVVPDAVSYRNHVLTTSSIIAVEYENHIIQYDLNTFISVRKGNALYILTKHLMESIYVCPVYLKMIYIAKKFEKRREGF